MNAVELSKLEALTKDYAAFQARKSGLATALGGLMAMGAFAVSMKVIGEGRPQGIAWALFFPPILWVGIRPVLERWLYRGLGQVKAVPDLRHERMRWHWILGLALFLLAFQAFCMLGSLRGILEVVRHSNTLPDAIARMEVCWQPWLGVMALPLVYLGLAPLAIRGLNGARVYAVLVIQSLIFLKQFLAWHGLYVLSGSWGMDVCLHLGLQFAVLVWAIFAMAGGWREHREYLAMLRNLPDIKEPV